MSARSTSTSTRAGRSPNSRAGRAADRSGTPGGTGRPPTILLAEDEESFVEALEIGLSKEGFRVAVARDGHEALHLFDEVAPDLILLDLMLPKYGGFEVLRRLQSGEYKGIPIIVISGKFVDPATVDMIRQESNVVEFLAKPVRPPQLMAVVHRVLKTRSPQPPAKA